MHRVDMHPFEKLQVWKRAHALAVRVYQLTVPWRDYWLRDQVRRAGTSIAANIAEGAGSASQRELARFLSIALGSAAELRGLVLLATEVSVLTREQGSPIDAECEELRRMLTALRKRILARENAKG